MAFIITDDTYSVEVYDETTEVRVTRRWFTQNPPTDEEKAVFIQKAKDSIRGTAGELLLSRSTGGKE